MSKPGRFVEEVYTEEHEPLNWHNNVLRSGPGRIRWWSLRDWWRARQMRPIIRRLKRRLTAHRCPDCGILHGGVGQ